MKKPAGSVRFRFYKQKIKKTEPNPTKNPKKNRANPSQNWAKPSQTEKTEPKPRKTSQNRKNRAKPVWTGFCPKKPNRTETGRFDPVSVFFFKKKIISVWLFFLIKTEPNRKWSPLSSSSSLLVRYLIELERNQSIENRVLNLSE